MTPQAHQCEFCGAPAVVHVMHEIGRPGSARHLCMPCADGCEQAADVRRCSKHRSILIGIALLVMAVPILAEWLAFGQAHAFGSWRFLLLSACAVIIFSGALLRLFSVFAAGLCFLSIFLTADYLGPSGGLGFGAGQTAAAILTCLLMAAAVTFVRFRRAGA